MGAFRDLGKALRWLRTRQDKKQYEVAEAAGITKAMLSAYETGKQNPSIETLEKILEALHSELPDLHHALSVNQQGGDDASESAAWRSHQLHRGRPFAPEPRINVYQILDLDEPLPADQEFAFTQTLAGFHSLLRLMYRQSQRRFSELDFSELAPDADEDD